jgi:hypothetical protein
MKHFPRVRLGVYSLEITSYSFTKDGKKIYKNSNKVQRRITSQENQFLFFSNSIGVFKENNNSYDVHMITNYPDNRTFTITPSHYTNGRVDAFTGIMTEPNYNPSIYTRGTPTIAALSMKWFGE